MTKLKQLLQLALVATGIAACAANAQAKKVDVTTNRVAAAYGYKAMGAAFNAVGGNPYDIQNFKPVPPAGLEGIMPGAFFIYELEEGSASDSYVYLPDGEGPEGAGWYAECAVTRATRTFLPGEGFLFYSNYDGDSGVLQSVVKAADDDIVTPAAYGYKAMCNPFSVELPLNGDTGPMVVPVPPAGAELEPGAFFIYEIDGGAVSDSFVYLPAGESPAGAGWYAEGAESLTTRKLSIGEGFAFYSNYDGADCGSAKFVCPDSIKKVK